MVVDMSSSVSLLWRICRIGGMPFVVGVEGGHRDRPEQRRSVMTHYLMAVHGPA